MHALLFSLVFRFSVQEAKTFWASVGVTLEEYNKDFVGGYLRLIFIFLFKYFFFRKLHLIPSN